MSLQLTITNGETSVSLLDASGFSLLWDYSPGALNDEEEVTEQFTAVLKGSSHDNIALQIQELNKLLRKASQYQSETWQNRPVYVISQTEHESQPRFALIKSGRVIPRESPYQKTRFGQNIWLNIDIQVTRSGHWGAYPPNQLPDAIPLGHKGTALFAERSGDLERLLVLRQAALSGYFGGAIRIDGAGTEASWTDTTPDNQTDFVLEFQISVEDLEMAIGDEFALLACHGNGAGGLPIFGYLGYDASGYYFNLWYSTDITTVDMVTEYFSGSATFKIVWIPASAPAANDGTITLYKNGVQVDQDTGIDSDGHDVDDIEIGTVGNLDAGTSGLLYLDRIRWADADDGAWHNQIDFEGEIWAAVGGVRVGGGITHIFNYDASLTVFSANLVGEAFTLFEVSGSTPAIGDAVYFGSTEDTLFNVIMWVGTVGVFDATIVLEYYDGSVWVNLGKFINDFDEISGLPIILINSNDNLNFAETSINGVAAAWLRLRISALTSWTTSPALAAPAYAEHDNYVEIPGELIKGDSTADLLLRWDTQSHQTHDGVGLFLMGLKSRGLENFVSLLNAGGANPAGWTETYGTNTTMTAAPGFPGKFKARCTFADNSNQLRLTIAQGDPLKQQDFVGIYRIYALVRCDSGSPGDVQLQLRISQDTEIYGEQIRTKFDDTIIELVDLGRFEILSSELRGEESSAAFSDLEFRLYAQADNTTVNIDIHALFLQPIDEWSTRLIWQKLANQLVYGRRYIELDSGVLREGALQGRRLPDLTTRTPVQSWSVGGELPKLEPGRDARIYILPISWDDTSEGFAPSFGNTGLFSIHPAFHWRHLRGGE